MIGWPALFAAALAGAAPGAPAPVVEGRFAPRDECAALPGAKEFRTALAEAAHRRDAEALVALADPQVKLDFGEGAGRAELRRRLAGEQGAELWSALGALLPLGCAVQEGRLVLPWFFAQDLGDDDAYDLLLVTGEAVPLRTGPSAQAPPQASLSWTLVEPAAGFDPAEPFQQVRLTDGRATGYVETARLRSPIDYRLIASRAGEGWAIEAFIAGD